MKFNLLIIVFLIIKTTVFSQTINWEKIIIEESHAGWSSFHNEYQILKKDLSLTLVDQPDRIVKKLKIEQIDKILISITNKNFRQNDPLTAFGKDSTWLIKNAEKLWINYLDGRKEYDEINKIAIQTIKDYHKIKDIIKTMQGSFNWTDDYPSVKIYIINKSDTINLYSDGQYPYMLPWYTEEGKIYNGNLSKYIAELLPENKLSQKKRLDGSNFNYYLIDKIYRYFIEDKVEFVRVRRKYPNSFKKLEKHFKIIDAEMSMMGSIEWGGFVAANCLEIVLIDTTVSEKIWFSTIFGRRLFLHPINPIIRKKKKLLKQLENNYVYNYTLNCEDCIGEIHFVNRKSLSNQAKRNFLQDVKENNLDKSLFKGRFKNAIFFELTEKRNGKRSFSRWIFLQDGTYILWEIKGDYLMNLPKEITQKNGYVCQIINFNSTQ